MYPLAHLERKIKTHRRKKIDYHLANVLGFILLPIIAIVIAPLLHESLHMFFLGINNIQYSMKINFDWENGIYGELTPFSELSMGNSIILLGVGVLGNLLLSAILFLGSWRIKNTGRVPESIFSIYLAVGFFYNPLIYFFSQRGDLVNILMLMGLEEFFYVLPIIGCILFLLVSLYIYKHARYALWEYYRIDEEIERLEQFLGFRPAPESQRG